MPDDNLWIMRYLDTVRTGGNDCNSSALSGDNTYSNAPPFFFQSKNVDTLVEKLNAKIVLISKIHDMASKNDKESQEFFHGFYVAHRDINLAYSTLLLRIRKDIASLKASQDKDKLKERIALEIADRMVVAKLLSVILPREQQRYIREFKFLGQSLYDISDYNIFENKQYYDGDQEKLLTPIAIATDEISDFIGAAKRDVFTPENNLFRLFLLRLRRIELQLAAIFASLTEYVSATSILENNGFRLFFTYIVPLWFGPRLIFNIYLTASAIYGSSDYSALELSFDPSVRFNALMSLIWGEIVNDLMWVSSGIIGCILAFGAYAFVLPYIAIVAQTYDFITSIFRYIFDTQRLEGMIKIYEDNKAKKTTVDKSNDGGHLIAIQDLKERLELDRQALLYAMGNFFILMCAAVFLLPIFGTISPIIPLVAGIAAVLVTIWHFNNTRYFNQERNKLYTGNLIPANACAMLVYSANEITWDDNNDAGNNTRMPKVDALRLGIYLSGFLRVVSEDRSNEKLYYVDLKNEQCKCQEVVSEKDGFIDMFDDKVNATVYDEKKMDKFINKRAKTLPGSVFDELCDELELKAANGTAIKKPSPAVGIYHSIVSACGFG